MTERKCFVFRFADVEVREREFLMIKAGERITVEPKAFRVLLFLLRNPGRLIPKDEIVDSVWSGSAVSDNSLTRSVAQLRRVLGDDSREPLYILTVPTVGYRFLCEVKAEEDGFRGTIAASLDPSKNQNESEPDHGAASRTLLFAGLAAALLLVLVAAFLARRAINPHRTNEPSITHPLIEQRITSNPSEVPVRDAIISPDGKYLAYADPTGLYLRQLSNGETRPWSLPKGFVAWPNGWFPDSTHLLVVRIEGQTQGTDLWKPSLYRLSLLGGDPQKIMNDAAAGAVSPDGSKIAYLAGPNPGGELWVMDSDGANPRKVVSAGALRRSDSNASWILPPVWGPNGRRIAYIEGDEVGGSSPVAPTVSLLTIDPNGGGPTAVLNDSGVGPALWWVADGRILFAYRENAANKSDNFGVYSIRINERSEEGAGPPQAITQAEGGIERLSATADGRRLVVWRTHVPTEVFIAKFDAPTHQFQEPRRLTMDENTNYATAWTPDSKAVLFVSNRNGTLNLFKQGIDETTPEALVEGPNINLARLSPDGSQILYLSGSGPGGASSLPSIMSKPLAGGPPHLVLQDSGVINFGCARAPSKLCVFSKQTGSGFTYASFELEHPDAREISHLPGDPRNWVISPDGSKLAIVLDRHRIRFLSLGTGAAQDVTVKDWPLNGVDWSADGRSLFMASVTPKGIQVILEVDQAGKANVVLQGNVNNEFVAMIQSPDQEYGLVLESTPAENNAWLVDDF
jgi:Tol biopolymer transport system component/DNA-binding winged helix-turn-helix (wHTH) protein